MASKFAAECTAGINSCERTAGTMLQARRSSAANAGSGTLTLDEETKMAEYRLV